jgi:hypothetical protein
MSVGYLMMFVDQDIFWDISMIYETFQWHIMAYLQITIASSGHLSPLADVQCGGRWQGEGQDDANDLPSLRIGPRRWPSTCRISEVVICF